MSSVTLHLESDALREATSQAILGLLTPEMRVKLVDDAIRSLLAPSKNSWDKGKSPLEEAFERAVHAAARDVAQAHIAADAQIRAKLEALVADVARRVLNQDVEKMSEKMANAFVESIVRER